MQIGYMIRNNLILFIVFSFTIVWGLAFNLKKKVKCKLHVNLPVMPSTEALPGGGGGNPMLLVWISNILCRCFSKLDVAIGSWTKSSVFAQILQKVGRGAL